VTEQPITLAVAPDRLRDIEPPGAVMSMLSPEKVVARRERGDDVIRSLCHWIFFFASEEAAREWTSERPATTTLPLEEGFELGRQGKGG
jgi:Alkylmercury lyase